MKVDRHAKIVELIGKYEIETQEELAEYLTKAGYQVTQATVSRDIRELKLSKVQAESGKQRYVVFQSHFHEIVGCIAGDDTIMCAVRSVDDTILVMDKLRKLIAG